MAESWASSEGVRRSMLANRSRDTGSELAIRKRVHAMGLRYRVSARPISGLRGTADLVFATERIAVFIDGCFWHGCPEHRRSPRAYADYWSAKSRGTGCEMATPTTRSLSQAGPFSVSGNMKVRKG